MTLLSTRPHRGPRAWLLLGSVLAAAALGLAIGYTLDPDGDATPLPPTTASSPTSPDYAPVLEYWRTHPGNAPEGFTEDDVILDESSTGPAVFDLPSGASYAKLGMSISCVAPSEYVLQVLNGTTGEVETWTKGNSCGGISLAISPDLPADGTPRRFVVLVDKGTPFNAVLFAVS